MSPFLAEVHVINLAGEARSITATASAGTSDDGTAEFKAEIKAKVDAALKKAAQIKEDTDEDGDSSGTSNVTINNGGKSIVVQHSKSKSNDEDMVFAAIPIVAIVFTFLYLIVRALMAPFTNRNKRGMPAPPYTEGLSAEESALLEKLQRTLVQMESRVESLETILIDSTRNKEKYGSKL